MINIFRLSTLFLVSIMLSSCGEGKRPFIIVQICLGSEEGEINV